VQEAKNLPDGVLWVQPSQDASRTSPAPRSSTSTATAPEVVYRDECYMRVYDGKSGKVLFSGPASSGTGMEYPSIADVDGDFATEIVVPRTAYNACPAKDPLFPDSGAFSAKNGFVIYRDPQDRWANSRPIWNQHQYSVVHIEDNARVPKASALQNNWQIDDLNNSARTPRAARQAADRRPHRRAPDLGMLCDFEGGTKELSLRCATAAPTRSGRRRRRFLETTDINQGVEEAVLICEAKTSKLLMPGDCEVVSAPPTLKGGGNIYVDVDPRT
jgi:hypothetical protein